MKLAVKNIGFLRLFFSFWYTPIKWRHVNEKRYLRKDEYNEKKEGVIPNYAEVVRRWDRDYRTVKRYFEQDVVPIRKNSRPSKVDSFKQIIKEKS